MAILPRRYRDPLEEDFIRDEIGKPVALPDIPAAPSRPLPMPPGASYPARTTLPESMQRQARGASRTEELQEARDVYLKGSEGRGKSGLRGAIQGALQGLASGQGIGAALGGAVAGGLTGAVSPQTIRRQQFDTQVRPQIEERWAMENEQRALGRQQSQDALDAGYKQAQIGALNRQNLPRPERGPTPAWKQGTSRRTGKRGFYNAADPTQNAEFEPYNEEQRGFAPHWVETPDGFVNLNAPGVDPKKVRKLQRPRAAAKPKEQKTEVGIDDIRAAIEAARQQGKEISESQMKTNFRNRGFIVK